LSGVYGAEFKSQIHPAGQSLYDSGCIIAGVMTAGLLADVGQPLLAMLRTVAGQGDMDASTVDRFVDRRAR
jgi:hypothetical protein